MRRPKAAAPILLWLLLGLLLGLLLRMLLGLLLGPLLGLLMELLLGLPLGLLLGLMLKLLLGLMGCTTHVPVMCQCRFCDAVTKMTLNLAILRPPTNGAPPNVKRPISLEPSKTISC